MEPIYNHTEQGVLLKVPPFVAEYKALCRKYGLLIAGEGAYTHNVTLATWNDENDIQENIGAVGKID